MVDVPMAKCTQFCTYYFDVVSRDELIIPSDFVKEVQDALLESAVLKDRYDNVWRVKIKKIRNIWYFRQGWKKFVSEYSLKCRDMLIFKYLGEGIFRVNIFGENACEKPPPPNTIVKKKASTACGNNRAKDPNYNEHAEKDEGDEYDTEDEDKEENNEDDVQGEQVMEAGAIATQTGSKRMTAADMLGIDLFDSGLARKPTNPYIVTRYKASKRDALFIPKFFFQIHEVELPEIIKVVDERKREFSLRRKNWSDGRTRYVGGWKKICKSNSVNPDDRCICEFVGGKDRKLHIRFSVIRANGRH